MRLKILLLAIIVSLGFYEYLQTIEHPPVQSFQIALYSNKNGIEYIRDYVLTKCSNPRSKYYGKYLSTDQINRLVQPNSSRIVPVLKWLRQYNITFVVYGDTIHCIGDIFSIGRLLKLTLSYKNGRYVSTRKPSIPDSLKEYIQFIEGISFRPNPSFERKLTRVSTGHVTREVLSRVYNMVGDGLSYSKLTSVGVMEYQGQSGFRQSDMVKAQVASNVPPHNVSENHIVGPDSLPDGESQLDMAVIWWGNGNATIWYEDYTGWMFGWASSFLNRKDYPEVVSLSWGWNERDQCSITHCFLNETSKEYVERTNNEFMKLAAKGVTIVVASGDAGSPGRTNEECVRTIPINPIFPGSSEWVTSVGATYLVASDKPYNWKTPLCKELGCANGTIEEMTTFERTGWTSGAGWSWWSATPKWQLPEVNTYFNSGVYFPPRNTWNYQGRGYPDVSAFGHSCTLHDGNVWTTEDGTSCAAPVFAGIITYLNDHQRKMGKSRLGFVNPLLYHMYRQESNTFNDITVGNSSCTEFQCCDRDHGFVPTKGWDVVSGLGTPNIGNIISWLDRNT